jgi:hypothetical protein
MNSDSGNERDNERHEHQQKLDFLGVSLLIDQYVYLMHICANHL